MSRFSMLLPLLLAAACTEAKSADKAPPSPATNPPEASAPQINAPKGPLALGTAMPAADVEMKNVDGLELNLSGVAGDKGTLVIFTCNHCPYAKAWEERIAKIGNEWMEKGFGVMAINPNDPSKYAEDAFDEMVVRARTLGMKFPYVVDGRSDVARAYGATKTPEVYLFDAEAKLVYQGAVDDNAKDAAGVDRHYLTEALTAISTGKKIPMPVTKAVGCSIKFRPEA